MSTTGGYIKIVFVIAENIKCINSLFFFEDPEKI